jgi:hypothetical protein
VIFVVNGLKSKLYEGSYLKIIHAIYGVNESTPDDVKRAIG